MVHSGSFPCLNSASIFTFNSLYSHIVSAIPLSVSGLGLSSFS
jgi:hypothetical protein